MKRYRTLIHLGALFLLSLSAFALNGCNATNDNPITPEKMEQIRQKEDADRRNFNPSTTPPPSAGTNR